MREENDMHHQLIQMVVEDGYRIISIGPATWFNFGWGQAQGLGLGQGFHLEIAARLLRFTIFLNYQGKPMISVPLETFRIPAKVPLHS